MARSMTGYGDARGQVAGAEYAVEVRAVNSRYFKAVIRLPEMWGFLETDIESLLRRRLHRGSIHLTMRMKASSPETTYEVNTAALERYLEQIEMVRPDQTDVALTVDLASLLQLPGVCLPPEAGELAEKAGPALMAMVDQAIDAVIAMRLTEGKSIAEDLRAQCQLIEQRLGVIAGRADCVVADYHDRLKRRVEELTAAASLKIDEADLAREVAIFAERCDIAEEISRLRAHLQQFREALEGEERPGRKLEFIAQEMLREANTIAAKAGDSDIARNVVEIKTAVDRIKEQTQNLE